MVKLSNFVGNTGKKKSATITVERKGSPEGAHWIHNRNSLSINRFV